jgi:ABC-type branched-subunit amino acid transport system substrate-binding protein
MKFIDKSILIALCALSLFFLQAYSPAGAWAQKGVKATKPVVHEKLAKANYSFDVNKMGDMSDFDPATVKFPTGDTIKIAVVASFTGPAAIVGKIYWASVAWAAYDINQRGGILVDGKKKFVEVIQADHMSRLDQCKKVTERMVLQEKVHVMVGTDGSHLMKVINQVAKQHKVIAVNITSTSDELMDATNYSPYAFMSCLSSSQVGSGLGYFYGKIRKKEKKFYIICQDYAFGRSIADSFKKGLKQYYPQAKIVGEDYHKLFLTDFAPYLEKIKAAKPDVIFTGDWIPDGANLVKQARQMGLKQPFAHLFLDDPNFLHEVGPHAASGNIQITQYGVEGSAFKTPEQIKYYKTWHDLWANKWKTEPYNSRLFEHGSGNIGSYRQQAYWLLSVIERAGSTDPEKIIAVWENDTYRLPTGKVLRMRACDHKVIQDLHVFEYVPAAQQKVSMNIEPYYWYKDAASTGPTWRIPAEKIMPLMDAKIDRCAGKNVWGE